MALMYPFHVAQPPLNWSEHLWVSDISPAKESFITAICEHRQVQWDNQDLLRHLQESVAVINERPSNASGASGSGANAQN